MKITETQSKYWLIAILVVAAIVRLIHINQPFVDYYSWREASTAMMADNFYRRNWNIFYPEISWNGLDPSYNGREFQTVSYLAALLYIFVGQQDWVGRLVPLLFGLWSIFALYHLIQRVWGREQALFGAAVLALLPGGIFIDREFLPDPAMVALITTSLWFFVVYCQTSKVSYLWLAALIGMGGFLTKLTGLIIGIPMLYALFEQLRQQGADWFGIVGDQYAKIKASNPGFIKYLDRTYERQNSAAGVIYHIPSGSG